VLEPGSKSWIGGVRRFINLQFSTLSNAQELQQRI